MPRQPALKPDDFMMFYVGDYIASTSHLHTLEHGAYLLILFHYWRTQTAPPDDDSRLARIARLSVTEWDTVSVTVRSFFHPVFVDGQWVLVNSKLERTMWKAHCAMAKNKAASKAGNAAKAAKRQAETRVAAAAAAAAHRLNEAERESDTVTGSESVSVTGSVSVSVPERERERDIEERKESLRDSCAKPADAGPPPQLPIPLEPPAIVMQTNRFETIGETVAFSQAKVDQWQKTYPGVNVPAALQAMAQWLIDNPANRKTVKGMASFVNRWLAKEQNRSARGPSNGQQSFRQAQNSRFIRGLGRNADRDRGDDTDGE